MTDEKQFNILKAQSALRGRLLQEVRNKLGPLLMGLEDEGDRIYLGSTNDKDWLTEIEQDLMEVDDEVWAVLNREETDPYADLYNLRVNVLPALRDALDPFSGVLSNYDPEEENDETPGTLVVGSITDYSLTLGDLRRAQSAIDIAETAIAKATAAPAGEAV